MEPQNSHDDDRVHTPPQEPDTVCDNADAAVEALVDRYTRHTAFLTNAFKRFMNGDDLGSQRVRAWYPEIRIAISSFADVDSRLSYGHVSGPGQYAAGITRPDLYHAYLREQVSLLIKNYGVPVTVGQSDTPIPLHFAFGDDAHVDAGDTARIEQPLRDYFDVPELATIDDHIVNGTFTTTPGKHRPHRRAAPGCVADARPLCGIAQDTAPGRLRARPRLRA